MIEEAVGVITILEGGQTVAMFATPEDSYAARSLWVFLVQNLRPGLEVTLVHDHIRLRHATGETMSPDLYGRIMRGSSSGRKTE